MKNRKRALFSKIILDLSKHGVRYAVLGDTRSLECEKSKKDVDILVDIESESELKRLLLKRGFFVDPRLSERPYLYGVNRFLYFRTFFSSLRIDVCFQLTVDSINSNREVVPLHKKLQFDAFAGIDLVPGGSDYCRLSKNVEFVYLFAREFFNHRLRAERSETLLVMWQKLSDTEKCYVYDVLPLIFFDFAPKIIESLEQNNLDRLFSNYIRYRNY